MSTEQVRSLGTREVRLDRLGQQFGVFAPIRSAAGAPLKHPGSGRSSRRWPAPGLRGAGAGTAAGLRTKVVKRGHCA